MAQGTNTTYYRAAQHQRTGIGQGIVYSAASAVDRRAHVLNGTTYQAYVVPYQNIQWHNIQAYVVP